MNGTKRLNNMMLEDEALRSEGVHNEYESGQFYKLLSDL